MKRAVVIGECMVELGLAGFGAAHIGFAGDTFNTAVYLQRLGVPTAYATAVGKGDPFSQGIVDLVGREGVGRDLIVEVEGRMPGLYAIETDAAGERRFFYWRDAAPARQYMALIDLARLKAAIAEAPLVYLSAISLAILEGRAALIDLLKQTGAPVVLDTNYRARLWPSPQAAREAVTDLAPHCRYVSMSAEDMTGLGLDADQCAQTWSEAGVEVVLRAANGAIEVHAAGAVERFPPPASCPVVDTTGAGDAFNAGYLAGRLGRKTIAQSLSQARQLAEAVIALRGAIIPKSAMPL